MPGVDAPAMLGKLGTLALGVDMQRRRLVDARRSPVRRPGTRAVVVEVTGSTAAVSVLCSMPVAVIVLPPKLRSEPRRAPAL